MTSRAPVVIANPALRNALLSVNGLSPSLPDDPLPPVTAASGPAWVQQALLRLAHVQVDSIAAVQRRFRRGETHPGYTQYFSQVSASMRARVLKAIRERGALAPREVVSKKVPWTGAYFSRPSLAKMTMEYLWRAGMLAVTRRNGQDGRVLRGLYSLTSVLDRLGAFPDPPDQLRVLNPFDPLVHDRGSRRTQRIFGFEQRMEIWVPPEKREYGYYVLPIMEGSRFIGRVDAKLEKSEDTLRVLGLWRERGIGRSPARLARLRDELEALARFAGAEHVSGL